MEEKIKNIVEKHLNEDQVLVDVMEGFESGFVRIVVDSESTITLDDTANLTKKLIKSDEFNNRYSTGCRIEITTPGVNVPLKKAYQFKKNINKNVKIRYKNEDQINSITGYINQESIDPLADFFFAKNYTDLGASFLVHSTDFLIGINFDYLNQPNVAYDTDVEFLVPISYGIQAAYEFNLNPYDRRFLPRYSYLYAYTSVRRDSESINIFSSQEFQLGEFSVGANQQFGLFDNFSFLNLGLSVGLTYENFDFGVSYAFSVQDLTTSYRYPPRIFDLFLSFDFSPFLRNRRGQYKRLQVDNYF